MNSLESRVTGSPALVVDLDRPLILTRIEDELFWAGLSNAPERMMGNVSDGKAEQALDVSLLPYDEQLVTYLREQRSDGFRTALVSKAHPEIAARVAEHLGVFDDVHEADALELAYGSGGYAYADGSADGAAKRGFDPAAFLKALRPHQWLKNLLIFVPMMTAHAVTVSNIASAISAFVAFSLVASSVYLLNDLVDLASDRAHPRKRQRPFASGRLSLRVGQFAVPALLGAGAVIGFLVSPVFFAVLAGYFAITLAYSFALKQKAIVDICTLAGLYTLRIVAGGAAVGLAISVWLLAFSIFFFFALASIKRQAELVDGIATGKVQAKGRDYTVHDVGLVSQMALSSSYVAVLVLALYLNSPAVQELYSTPAMLWGICLILLYWLSRAVWKTHRGEMHDDPIIFAVRDRISQIAMIVVALFAYLGIAL